MQPLNILRHLRRDMVEYVSSKYPFLERGRLDLHEQLKTILEKDGTLFQDAVLQLVRGRPRADFDKKSFHSALHSKLGFSPYSHQVKAWTNIQTGVPTVVSTGTGSGKSECFIYPVIDGLLKGGFGNGPGRVGALCLYPMNALVEDQYFRFQKALNGTGLRVGIYNGSFKTPTSALRKKILKQLQDEHINVDPETVFVDPNKRETIPHILLTNYRMLEFMLLRSSDQGLFKDIDLRYLVLDEAHTYSGTLGLEIACLIARLRVHLGDNAKAMLPIATSATLFQGSGSVEDASKIREDMRRFFSQLFGVSFPGDKNWLIEDEFEDLTPVRIGAFDRVLKTPRKEIADALAQPFPGSFLSLSKLIFGLDLGSHQGRSTKELYTTWGKTLYPHVAEVAKQLPSILLCEAGSSEPDAVVSFRKAITRFEGATKGTKEHLEALLILCSQAFEQSERWPALGIRLHLFGKAEPKVYWTLDGKNLFDEPALKENSQLALDFISCRKCGHMAWAGRATPVQGEKRETCQLQMLPAFFEDVELKDGSEIFVLHSPNDVDAEVLERKGWSAQWYEVDATKKTCSLMHSKKKVEPTAATNLFLRVRRVDSKGRETADTSSCPSCGESSGQEERAILMTPRGGAATDIGVYGASLMTALDLAEERRLLIFADNRQETAFLAGFLTDRHRRLNLRRAIATFLHESVKAGDTTPWRLLRSVNREEEPAGHRYDFAARVLLSLSKGRFCGRDPLPKKLTVSKRLLSDLIPRDALEVDYLDRMNRDQNVANEFKNWLLSNTSIGDGSKEADAKQILEEVELFQSDKGTWCLQLFHEVLLLEISSLVGREGSLQTIGLASWGFPDFSEKLFQEFAKAHPEFLLDSKALFAISFWLLLKLSEFGQWQGLDESTRRHALGKKGRSDLANLETILGAGFKKTKGISKNSIVGRLLTEFGGDEARLAWSQEVPWLKLLNEKPLENFIALTNDNTILRIKTERVHVTSSVQLYRGTKSGKQIAVDSSLLLDNFATGRRDDVWIKTAPQVNGYYRLLYQRTFTEEARLVRALEHNGMLGGTAASDVLDQFKDHTVNTLVATPTLEMGVDLPDLPIVIHRSVPPDPSNYAQRAGRAGRDPKRAFVLTHCGFGSHDLTFYLNPEQMVSGEILPPGLPTENISILRRHSHGLVLELMSLTDYPDPMNVGKWSDLIDLSDLRKVYESLGGDISGFPASSTLNWEKCLRDRAELINTRTARFIELLSQGLWSQLPEERRNTLRRRTEEAANIDAWANAFRSELARYRQRAETYVEDLRRWKEKSFSLDKRQNKENEEQLWRANSLAKLFLGEANEANYPLNYLAASGFLPHFDFPGRSGRFIGVLPQYQSTDKKGVSKNDRYLSFERSAEIALREFAPEQRVYGQGFVYRVDRYVADGKNNEIDSQRWGICTMGCSQLSKPGSAACECCGADLVYCGNEKHNQPKLISVQEAHGVQAEVISDKSAKREFNRTVQDIRRLGIPNADKAFKLNDCAEIVWTQHSTEDNQLKTVSFLSGAVVSSDEQLRITPVYKESGNENNSIFRVKLTVAEEEISTYEPFLPAVFGKGQALILRLPSNVLLSRGWIPSDTDLDGLNSFYRTFGELISRSALRVLRLNKRKAALKIIDDKLMSQVGDGQYAVKERHVIFLDTEEGGSGVIELLWNYWDEILEQAKALVLKECCVDSCYLCLKSYDNQWFHHQLKKSLFLSPDGETEFLDTLRKYGPDSKLRISDTTAENHREVDAQSPAEKVFDEYLQAHYPLGRETQSSVFSLKGREVTRPDFVLEAFNGERVHVFVDGKQYHGTFDAMLGDVEKRNFLAKQGGRVLSLPAGLLLPKIDNETLSELLVPLKQETALLSLHETGATLRDFPFVVEQETLAKLHSSKIKFDGWRALDQNKCKTEVLAQIKSAKALQYLSLLDSKFFSIGRQADALLCPVFAAELFSNPNDKQWEAVLLLHSLLATRGYRVFGVWVGSRAEKKAA